MSENNINNKPTYILQQKVEFIDNTTYNPFAPNQNRNLTPANNHNNFQITRPYLNEIQNEGPKTTNTNNKQTNENNSNSNKNEISSSFANLQSQNNQNVQIKTNYELSLEYENALRQEIELTTPLISEKLNIQILLDDYKSNEEYSNSVKIITEKYNYIRKVRRDGNCFYRSFIYRIFEYICMKSDKSLYDHMIKKIEEAKEITKKNGYDWIVVEDFYNVFYGEFLNCFNCISSCGVSVRDYLDNLFLDKDKSNYLIYFVRFCIAAYLKENYMLYEVYVEGSFENWIHSEVEAIDHEADQIQIMACVNYFDIGVIIEYLNPYKNEVVKFPEDKKDDDIFITVLFTPGHYEILYS